MRVVYKDLPLALKAAAAGKHVYLEKPMALNTLECQQIIDACRAAGVLLSVASQSRYNEMNQRVKSLVEDGTLGELRFIKITSRLYTACDRCFCTLSGE